MHEKIYRFIATWFYSGLSPKMPGTAGTIAALPFAVLIAYYGQPLLLLPASLVAFLIGWYVSYQLVKNTTDKDPKWIVIDEVAGMWLVLAFTPLSVWWYAVAFVLFRFFDMVKPFPISWADRKIKGGFGIMFDDILAGVAAIILLLLGLQLWA